MHTSKQPINTYKQPINTSKQSINTSKQPIYITRGGGVHGGCERSPHLWGGHDMAGDDEGRGPCAEGGEGGGVIEAAGHDGNQVRKQPINIYKQPL